MEKKVHRYVQHKDLLKKAVRHPLLTSLLLVLAYFSISLTGLFITGYFFLADGNEVQFLNVQYFIAGSFFLIFNAVIIFLLAFYALNNLHSAYLRVENEMEIRNTALLSVDHEIRELTSKISHDLKAPIRSVQGFSQAMTDDYSENLEPAALDYLNRIRRSAERMDNLINELVVYARLGSSKLHFEAIDCVNFTNKFVLTEVNRELQREVNFRTKGAIPIVYGDKSLVLHVLKEVFINAGTYVAEGVKPEVTMSGQMKPEHTVIQISDNGIGIDPAYHQSVFNIFTRLHGIEQYPGLGIGLAIAKRCINIMGGDITIESDGESGTTVVLTFAKPGTIKPGNSNN